MYSLQESRLAMDLPNKLRSKWPYGKVCQLALLSLMHMLEDWVSANEVEFCCCVVRLFVVLCCTVLCAVRCVLRCAVCCAVLCCAVLCGAVRCGAVRCCAVLCFAVLCFALLN